MFPWIRLLLIVGMSDVAKAIDSPLTPIEELGKRLFFDERLSSPAGQSCASCHSPDARFTNPDKSEPTARGVLPGRFGKRSTPTAMYAAFSPLFHYDEAEGIYIGGQFLDGRAPDLETQAQGPFLNPLEMANPDKATVVDKVRTADYATLFAEVFGSNALDNIDQAFVQIASAIASFERRGEFAPFSSKYDAFLAGRAGLSPAEERGLAVFEEPNKGNCAACHPNRPSADGKPPLFTDFSYDNLGVPRNPNNPFYSLPSNLNPDGLYFVDIGLGQTVGKIKENGKFKVPTLRNIQMTGPYIHNGYFTDLKSVVEFYNTRDTLQVCLNPMTTEALAKRQACWPIPEVLQNVNREELGDMKLSARDVDDLVAFLGTLTDGYGGVGCLLDWFEAHYPDALFPPGTMTLTQSPYVYRHYALTNSYVGVSSADNHVYYLAGGSLYDVGELASWSGRAGCPQPTLN